jgi:hypothetical protein
VSAPTRFFRKMLIAVAVIATLSAVFLLYWRPEMVFDAATKLWSCF